MDFEYSVRTKYLHAGVFSCAWGLAFGLVKYSRCVSLTLRVGPVFLWLETADQ